MALALVSIPQRNEVDTSAAIQANGADGSSGSSVECGSTKGDLALRSLSRGPGGVSAPPLDKNANLTANVEPEKSGVVAAARVERFALQAAARHLLPGERVANCLRSRIFGKEAVELWHIPETASARFGGLQTCGSVWMCPVCAAKISERRKVELETALKAAHELGWVVAMVTLTIPHGRADDPRGLVDRMMKARGKMTGHGSMRNMYDLAGVQGSVRALEVTHGANGWHPHIHELLFVRSGSHLGKLRKVVREQWFKAVAAAGLGECSRKAFRFDVTDTAIAEYVAKFGRNRSWNAEHELTKQVTKKGRGAGQFTPSELLAEFTFNGDAEAGALYVQYAAAMKRRAQLRWSVGLRAKLMIGLEPVEAVRLIEREDGELAEERDKKGELLALIPFPVWQRVLPSLGRKDLRPVLLNLASTGDEVAVMDFLRDLGNMDGSGRVEYVDRPRLVDRAADPRDQLLPAADPFALDPLVQEFMQGKFGTPLKESAAKDAAKMMYQMRGTGLAIAWFERRLKERLELVQQVHDELTDPFA